MITVCDSNDFFLRALRFALRALLDRGCLKNIAIVLITPLFKQSLFK